MNNFAVITDSAADLSLDFAAKSGLTLVPFYVAIEDTTYLKENVELTQADFFNQLIAGKMPKTSCPSINDYIEAFETALKTAEAVVCICLSSKLSGSYQSACNAAREFNEDRQRVFVVDSLLATATQGMLVKNALEMSSDGLSAQEAVKLLDEIKATGTIDVVIDDLEHLQKGGRIGKASVLIGNLFNIRPILRIKDGEILPLSKVRGRKKAVAEIKKNLIEAVELNGDDYSYAVLYYTQIGDKDDIISSLNLPLPICEVGIGATIGSHIGPTAVGIAYMKKYKK